ncbi:MAG: hypothetical protein IJT25_00605, partial [Clostridia bacterium]|nr:hypothetical protein [Clostridia bacterium]
EDNIQLYVDYISDVFSYGTWAEKIYNDLQVIYKDINVNTLINTEQWLSAFSNYYAGKSYLTTDSEDLPTATFNTSLIHPLGLIFSELFLSNSSEAKYFESLSGYIYSSNYDEDALNALFLAMFGEENYQQLVYQYQAFSEFFDAIMSPILAELGYFEGYNLTSEEQESIALYTYKAYLASFMLSTEFGHYLNHIAEVIIGAGNAIDEIFEANYDSSGRINSMNYVSFDEIEDEDIKEYLEYILKYYENLEDNNKNKAFYEEQIRNDNLQNLKTLIDLYKAQNFDSEVGNKYNNSEHYNNSNMTEYDEYLVYDASVGEGREALKADLDYVYNNIQNKTALTVNGLQVMLQSIARLNHYVHCVFCLNNGSTPGNETEYQILSNAVSLVPGLFYSDGTQFHYHPSLTENETSYSDEKTYEYIEALKQYMSSEGLIRAFAYSIDSAQNIQKAINSNLEYLISQKNNYLSNTSFDANDSIYNNYCNSGHFTSVHGNSDVFTIENSDGKTNKELLIEDLNAIIQIISAENTTTESLKQFNDCMERINHFLTCTACLNSAKGNLVIERQGTWYYFANEETRQQYLTEYNLLNEFYKTAKKERELLDRRNTTAKEQNIRLVNFSSIINLIGQSDSLKEKLDLLSSRASVDIDPSIIKDIIGNALTSDELKLLDLNNDLLLGNRINQFLIREYKCENANGKSFYEADNISEIEVALKKLWERLLLVASDSVEDVFNKTYAYNNDGSVNTNYSKDYADAVKLIKEYFLLQQQLDALNLYNVQFAISSYSSEVLNNTMDIVVNNRHYTAKINMVSGKFVELMLGYNRCKELGFSPLYVSEDYEGIVETSTSALGKSYTSNTFGLLKEFLNKFGQVCVDTSNKSVFNMLEYDRIDELTFDIYASSTLGGTEILLTKYLSEFLVKQISNTVLFDLIKLTNDGD